MKPKRAKRSRVSLVSMAEVIALCRVTRVLRDERGAIIGVERTDGAPLGAPAPITPGDVLAGEGFVGHYAGRPMR